MLHDPANPEFWLDGAKRSTDGGFVLGFGKPIDWASFESARKMRESQTARVERARAANDTSGTIARLRDVTKSYWNGAMKEPQSLKQQRHGGAFMRAK